MKPTKEQLASAVEELAAIPYFPQGAGAKVAIASQIAKFVGQANQLRWLIDSALNAMPEWKGIGELRGLHCTKFKPADGVEGWCTLSGYTPEDSEAMASREIYKSTYAELPEGLPFSSEINKLAVSKKIQ